MDYDSRGGLSNVFSAQCRRSRTD